MCGVDARVLTDPAVLCSRFSRGDYGYGWHIDKQFNQRPVFHTGVILGFKASIDRYLDDKVSIIILSNSDDTFNNAAIRDLAAGSTFPAVAKWKSHSRSTAV